MNSRKFLLSLGLFFVPQVKFKGFLTRFFEIDLSFQNFSKKSDDSDFARLN